MTSQQTNRSGNQPVPLDKGECASRLSRPSRLVHQAILRAFARTGQAPSRADLQGVAGAAGVELDPALAELNHADLVVLDRRGELLAAYPFSAAPTPHCLTLGGGVSVHAMCAIDALGVSAMLGQPVTVTSAQPGTGRQVTVQVDGDQATWEPPTAVVLVAAAGDCRAPSAQRTAATSSSSPPTPRRWPGPATAPSCRGRCWTSPRRSPPPSPSSARCCATRGRRRPVSSADAGVGRSP
jgi:Alkylmercury lyase